MIFGFCAALGVVVTALCVYRARKKPTMANWCITLAFAICTVGVFFAVPPVADWMETTTGVDNLAKLIANSAAILWCTCLQLAMVDIAYNPEFLRVAVVKRAFLAGITLLAMIPVWASATPGINFTTRFAEEPSVRIYLLIYLTYILIVCSELAFMCFKFARQIWPGRPWSSFGYGASSVAAVFGVGYALSKMSYLITYTIGSPWSLSLEERLSPAIVGLAIVFFFLGLTLPLGNRLFSKKTQTHPSE